MSMARGCLDACLSGWVRSSGGLSWVQLVVAVLGSSAVAAVMSAVLVGLRSVADARRDAYANAVRLLIARIEYPYRIRRRTSDSPEVLAELVSLGHHLQQELAAVTTWIQTENERVAASFVHLLDRIDASVGPACTEAWSLPPITSARDMNLGSWGPGGFRQEIGELQRMISRRFGWRRLRRPG
jgi:hypothetical protein